MLMRMMEGAGPSLAYPEVTHVRTQMKGRAGLIEDFTLCIDRMMMDDFFHLCGGLPAIRCGQSPALPDVHLIRTTVRRNIDIPYPLDGWPRPVADYSIEDVELDFTGPPGSAAWAATLADTAREMILREKERQRDGS